MLVALENGSSYLYLINFNKPDTYIEVDLGNVTNTKLIVQDDHKASATYTNESGDTVTDTILFTASRVYILQNDGYLETFDW